MLCAVLGQGGIFGSWSTLLFLGGPWAPSSAESTVRNQPVRHSSHQSGEADLLLLLVLPFLALSPSSFIHL